jgi:hypothetical protein
MTTHRGIEIKEVALGYVAQIGGKCFFGGKRWQVEEWIDGILKNN